MTVKLRFAPSPTGKLHVGNARTALVNYLFCKSKNGEMLLRIDDTDQERSKPEYEKSIKEDLNWLGIFWEKTDRQSSRLKTIMMHCNICLISVEHIDVMKLKKNYL